MICSARRGRCPKRADFIASNGGRVVCVLCADHAAAMMSRKDLGDIEVSPLPRKKTHEKSNKTA